MGNELGATENFPRILERKPLPSAYLIEEEEIDHITIPEWPAGTAIPASSFVDINHHVHIEYCNIAFDPTGEKRRLGWMINPLKYYRRIAPKVVDGSLVTNERDLIGGATFHYQPDKHEVYVQYWGIFSKEQAEERGIDPKVLKGAAAHQHAVMDRFHKRLGIKRMFTTSAVDACISLLLAYGWEEYPPASWRERLGLFTGTFPVSLRCRERMFHKLYK